MPCLFLDQSDVAFPIWSYRLVSFIEKSSLKLDKEGIWALAETREGYYDPPFSLKGKTVLDLGACCGETAWFYLKLGADKVYCVECDPARISMLNENKKNLGLNLEIIPEPLNMNHLEKLSYDFVKCDVEGAETILLDFLRVNPSMKPCVLEVHGKQMKEKFEEAGFHVIKAMKASECWIMKNWP